MKNASILSIPVPLTIRTIARVRRVLRRTLMLGALLLLTLIGYKAAFVVRFDASIPSLYQALFWTTLPYLVVIRLICLAYFDLHRGLPRYAGINDLIRLVTAVTCSSILFVLIIKGFIDSVALPRSIIVLDWVAAILLCGGALLLTRVFHEIRSSWARSPAMKRALIIGAGDAAACLLHDIRSGAIRDIRPVGLIDDDAAKRKLRIYGVPVLGTTRELKELVSRYRVDLLVIAIPSATGAQLQRIVERCAVSGGDYKIVPFMGDLLHGFSRSGPPREVRIEDLLGRSAVELDLSMVRSHLEGAIILVTGGAGSIGSELARQIARLEPARLLLLDKAESPLYFTHLEIAKSHPGLDVVPIIADITNRARLERVFATYQPTFVYHAAAYKHVPLMENHIEEAVRNNAIGTFNVADFAARFGAEQFVLVSTDKAVRPSSIMGATKRIAERLVLGLPNLTGSRTTFRAVRFGNVLGSDGSVIPLFKRQITQGGPVTVTHPEVTRYFMTIPEAAHLVLISTVLREAAGRIVMLEMGDRVGIVKLAENLIRLSGLEPYRDIPIVFTGMRPGEKLHEELFSDLECTIPTTVEKIRIVQIDETDGRSVEEALHSLTIALDAMDRGMLLAAIHNFVPECVEPLRSVIRMATAHLPQSKHPSRPRVDLHVVAK